MPSDGSPPGHGRPDDVGEPAHGRDVEPPTTPPPVPPPPPPPGAPSGTASAPSATTGPLAGLPPPTVARSIEAFPPPRAEDAAAAVVAPVEAPRRLHPLGIVRGMSLRSLSSLPALFIVGSSADIGFGLLVVLAFVLGTIASVIGWTRHTYELRGGRIIEKSGILSRTERALEIERIQQIDVERTMLDRLADTCELRLETAADSGDSELTLTVVTVEEAERLRSVLAEASARLSALESSGERTSGDEGGDEGGDPVDSAAGPERTIVAVPLQHVALAAVTGRRLLAIPAGIAVVLGLVFETLGPPGEPGPTTDAASEAVDRATSLGLIGAAVLVVALVFVTIVGAAVVGLLRDGGFEIVARGREVVVRRGLTTTRTATVPLRRIQQVTVTRSWIHTLAGFATVTIHTAGSVGRGGGQGGDGGLDRELRIPLLPEVDVDPVLDDLLGAHAVPPLAMHPRAARRRMMVRSLSGGLPLIIAGTAFAVLTDRLALLAVVLPLWAVLSVAAAWRRYGQLATGIGEQFVAGRSGLFGSRTTLALRVKVQGVTVSSTWFQRRRDLASASVHVAGPTGGIGLPDLGSDRATAVWRTLT